MRIGNKNRQQMPYYRVDKDNLIGKGKKQEIPFQKLRLKFNH